MAKKIKEKNKKIKVNANEKLFAIGDLSSSAMGVLFENIKKKFGTKWCFFTESLWPLCDGLRCEEFAEIWATKLIISSSPKLQKLGHEKKNVFVINKKGGILPFDLVYPKSNYSKNKQ